MNLCEIRLNRPETSHLGIYLKEVYAHRFLCKCLPHLDSRWLQKEKQFKAHQDFSGGSVVKKKKKSLFANAGDLGDFLSLHWNDPLEYEMATHSSIFAWKIPWTEDPRSPWDCKELSTHNPKPISWKMHRQDTGIHAMEWEGINHWCMLYYKWTSKILY